MGPIGLILPTLLQEPAPSWPEGPCPVGGPTSDLASVSRLAEQLGVGTASEVAEEIALYRKAGAAPIAHHVTADQPIDQFERLAPALPAARVRTRK
jgi:hypothetical protein